MKDKEIPFVLKFTLELVGIFSNQDFSQLYACFPPEEKIYIQQLSEQGFIAKIDSLRAKKSEQINKNLLNSNFLFIEQVLSLDISTGLGRILYLILENGPVGDELKLEYAKTIFNKLLTNDPVYHAILTKDFNEFHHLLKHKKYTLNELLEFNSLLHEFNAADNEALKFIDSTLTKQIKNLTKDEDNKTRKISIIATPYELKTKINDENSVNSLVIDTLKYLPSSCEVQIINVIADDTELYLPNVYSMSEDYDERIIRVSSLQIDFRFGKHIEVFRDLCNASIIIAHPNQDWLHTEYGVDITMYNDKNPIIIGASSLSYFSISLLKSYSKYIEFQKLSLLQQKISLASAEKNIQFDYLRFFLLMNDFKLAGLTLQTMTRHQSSTETLMVLTDVPDGTHGDASNAGRALRLFIQNAYYQRKKIIWVLRESNGELAVRDLIPVGFPNENIVIIKSWSSIHTEPKIIKALLRSANTDILSYPTCHYIPKNVVEMFKLFNAVQVDIAEYDLDGGSLHPDSIEDCKPNPSLAYLQTGFNTQISLGVFIEAKKTYSGLKKSSRLEDLSQHDLYFAYTNLEQQATMNSTIANIPTFCLLAIQCTLRKNQEPGIFKNVAVIARATPEDLDKLVELVSEHKLNVSSIQLFSPRYERVIKKLPNAEGIQVTLHNIFPMKNQEFKHLLAISEPFCLLTGDASFLEGISQNKIILYQTQDWKMYLNIAYQNLIHKQSDLGTLYEWHLAQNLWYLPEKDVVDGTVKQLSEYLKEPDLLIKQMEKLNNYLLEERNLQHNFVRICYNLFNMNRLPKQMPPLLTHYLFKRYQEGVSSQSVVQLKDDEQRSAPVGQDAKRVRRQQLSIVQLS